MPPNSAADVAAVVITHNNANEINVVLDTLRQETDNTRIRAIVVDNLSSDGTLAKLQERHPDVTSVSAGYNSGYAGGINLARPYIGPADSVLILNADVKVHAGGVRAMVARMATSQAGIVVPRILRSDGSLYPSIRHEPSLRRAFGDALFGGKFRRRGATFSEMQFDPDCYDTPHEIDWATGAALLIRTALLDAVGAWDERYFLYSEETDYMHRARDLGATIWFEPLAVVTHSQGASGTSPEFTSLSAVNRIRYIRKFHSGLYARLFLATAVLAELLRSHRAEHRRALRSILNGRSWTRLPHTDEPGKRPSSVHTGRQVATTTTTATAEGSLPLTIPTVMGYLVPEFPGQTHTFFWREIRALEALGIVPELVSTRRPGGGDAAHSWAEQASSRTSYLIPFSIRSAADSLSVLARSAVTARLAPTLRELRDALRSEPRVGVNPLVRQLGLLAAGAALAGMARRQAWHHVHVHSCADAAQVALFAHSLSGVSYSLTLHGSLDDYGPNQVAKWSNAEFAIVITQRLLDEVRTRLGSAVPGKVDVAPMGVDIAEFARATPFAPWDGSGTPRIFSCGRLNPSKGHADLITAVAELQRAGIQADLIIAGEDEQGGNGYRRTLETHIVESGIEERVTLLGAVSDRVIKAELERADVFCLASHAEPLGVAIMEALAFEVPVVATNAGGVPALIDDSRSGLLVEPGKPSSLASAMTRILTHPTFAAQLGAAGRKHIIDQFDSSGSARAIVAFLSHTGAAVSESGGRIR